MDQNRHNVWIRLLVIFGCIFWTVWRLWADVPIDNHPKQGKYQMAKAASLMIDYVSVGAATNADEHSIIYLSVSNHNKTKYTH